MSGRISSNHAAHKGQSEWWIPTDMQTALWTRSGATSAAMRTLMPPGQLSPDRYKSERLGLTTLHFTRSRHYEDGKGRVSPAGVSLSHFDCFQCLLQIWGDWTDFHAAMNCCHYKSQLCDRLFWGLIKNSDDAIYPGTASALELYTESFAFSREISLSNPASVILLHRLC